MAAATLVCASGCVSYQERPLAPEVTAQAFASRSLADAGLKEFLAGQHASQGSWTPDRVALAACYFHGDLAVARAEEMEAAAAITTAGERPNPVLSFSPGYNATSSGISPWIISPNLDLTIETAGKRELRLAQARANVEAARLRKESIAWTIRKDVRGAMLDLYAAKKVDSLLKAESALHDDELKKLELQVQAGESAGYEVTQARLALNRARLAQRDAESQRVTALAKLAAAAGLPASAFDSVTLDFSPFENLPPNPGESARRRALTHRADLLAALADYAAADADLRLEIARQYPDIHLNPGYELDQTDNKWTLGLSVELPILNQHHGPIAEAEARRKKLAATFEAKQAAVFGEIEVALAAYRAARDKVAIASELAQEAEHASETTRKVVETGELAPLELTRRRIESSASELALEEARIEALRAAGDLEAAIQTPLETAP